MADKKTDFEVVVGTTADKKGVKDTLKNINREINNSTKGGRIEVPVDITVPIDKTKPKLVKAQKEVTDTIKKMTSEGFSASKKDIKDLTNELQKFNGVAKKSGQKDSPIAKEINRQAQDLKKQYIELRKVEKVIETYETKSGTNNRPRRRRTDRYNPEFEQQEGEIEARLRQRERRILREIQSGEPRGYKHDTGFDKGVATSQTVLATDRGGSYAIKGAKQAELSRKEAELENAKSLTLTAKDIALANKMANQAIKIGGNKNQFTPEEKAKNIAKDILPELRRILTDIQKEPSNVSFEKFFKTLETVLKLNQEAGVNSLKSSKDVLNVTLSKWFSTKGALGVGNGTNKIDQTKAPEIEAILKGMLSRLDKLLNNIQKDIAKIEQNTKSEQKGTKTQRGISENSLAGRMINQTQIQSQKIDGVTEAIEAQSSRAERNYIQDIRESGRERSADERELQVSEQNKEADVGVLDTTMADYTSGMNTESSSTKLFEYLQSIKDTLSTISQYANTAQSSLSGTLKVEGELKQEEKEEPENKLPSTQVINPDTGEFYTSTVQDRTTEEYKKQKEKEKEDYIERTRREQARRQEAKELEQYDEAKRISERNARAERLRPTPVTEEIKNEVEKERGQMERGEHEYQQRLMESISVFTSQKGFFGKLGKLLDNLTGTTSEVGRIMAMNSAQQDRLRAERIATYGENKGRELKETGSKAAIRYIKTLFGWNYRNDSKNQALFQDVKLTSPKDMFQEIDTTKIMEGLNKALSGSQMFKAQTGGVLRNIIGSMTGYIGMPSIEKSRTQADALNQIMSNVRKQVLSLIQDIQAKESALRGMESAGMIKFNQEGRIVQGDEKSIADATKILADLEEQKGVLKGALAEVKMVDEVVSKTGGKIPKIIRQLGFVMPELMDQNTILQNINAGLDKNGRALKFQTRTAEILNYTFQLMSRSIGQMWKNWMVQLNPITQIKRAFQEFSSYNVKWQRTMNVVKYNIHAIIEPFMDKVAQFLVNCLGFVDIISQRLQKAYGVTKLVSLFDQSAAATQKMNEELEAAANVTAGFDELHDIGSNNSAANDLMGEIYKPKLSQNWIDLANRIGDLFEGVISGDMGFGEVMLTIIEILGRGLITIGKTIWNWLKNSTIGKYIQKQWKSILGTLLTVFLAWRFLKIAGALIKDALFGKLTGSAIGNMFSNIANVITNSLGWAKNGANGGWIYAKNWVGSAIQVLAGAASALVAVATIKIAFDVGASEGKQTAWGEQSDTKGLVDTLGKSLGVGLIGGALAGGLAVLAGVATTAFLPITAGIAAIAVAVRSSNL